MKRSSMALLALGLLSFEAVAALRTREQARALTANIMVSSAEVLEQFGGTEYPSDKMMALKDEIESCGITYTGTNCLDTKFENFGNAGVKDVDTGDKSGYVFFSRFRMKGDTRVLLMAVIANKSDCVLSKTDPTKCQIDPTTRQAKPLPAFRTGNIWALTPGRETPEIYIQDFLTCTESEDACQMRPLLAYDPVKGTREDAALVDLEGLTSTYTKDFRRFFHAAQVAATFPKGAKLDRAVRALTARSELVTKSGNVPYRSAFFTLIQTKFAAFPDLVADVAREVGSVAAAGSPEQLQATLIAARSGDTSAATLTALTALYTNARQPADLRKEALGLVAKAAKTPADFDKIIALLGSTDQVLRSGTYFLLGGLTFTEANLPAITKLLGSNLPNVRGNGLKALSRVAGDKALIQMAGMFKDKDVDVALSAVSYLSVQLDAVPSITELTFTALVEASTLTAPTNARDLLLARTAVLDKAFGKIKATPAAILAALKISAANKVSRVRASVVPYIAKLSSRDALTALINLVTDADAEVNAAVMGALQKKPLTDANLDLLYKLAMDKSVTVRVNAVTLIAGIGSSKALQALLKKSTENLDAQSFKVRAQVATLFGAIYAPETTSALLSMLNDQAAEVRLAAFTQLSKGDRLFDDAQVLGIRALVNSVNADVPARAVILLAQVNTVTSIAALNELLTAQLPEDVRNQVVLGLGAVESADTSAMVLSFLTDASPLVRASAEAVLNSRTPSDALLPVLSADLSSEDASLRLLAIRQIGRLSSQAAIDLLSARLSVETDETLKLELSNAIAAVTGRLPVTVQI